MKDMSDKQLRERMRFLSDKIENIWERVKPQIDEFQALRKEFNEIVEELLDRGVITNGEE